MTQLQSPQRRSYTAKTIFGLLLAVVMVGAFATAGSADNPGSPRRGQVHVEKECSQFSGQAGGFCTITASNLHGIDPGMHVVYTDPTFVFPNLISHLYVDGHGNNDAYGSVTLNVLTWIGSLTLSGGTGQFSGFHADITVDCTPSGSPCTWDGPYNFTPPGHDQ